MLTKGEQVFIQNIIQIACKYKAVPFTFNHTSSHQQRLQAKTSLRSTCIGWMRCIFQLIHTIVIASHIYVIFKAADLSSLWELAPILFNIALLIYNYLALSTLIAIQRAKFQIASLYNQIQLMNEYFAGLGVLPVNYKKGNLREKLLAGFIYLATTALLFVGIISPFLNTNLYWYYYKVLPNIAQGIVTWCMFGVAECYFWYYVITINWFIQLIGVAYIFTITYLLEGIW